MDCRNCSAALPRDAEYCQSCGAAVQRQPDEPNRAQSGGAAGGDSSAAESAVGSPQQSSAERGQSQYPEQQPQQRRQPASRNGGAGFVSQVRPLGGAVGGAVAFLIAFVINSALFIFEATSVPNSPASGDVVSQLAGSFSGGQVVSLFGWLFYNAHTVGVSVGSAAEGQTINILNRLYQQLPAGVSTVPQVLYTVVPILTLLLVGYILGRGARTAGTGAVRGVSVTVGYLILAVGGGVTVFTASTGVASAGPDLGSTVILMGVVFPVVAGGAGGALAGQTGSK